ncbi:radical SAM protein [Myxococcota bacterium]|nr:radical SAM protein [Myxococcota bacterium]
MERRRILFVVPPMLLDGNYIDYPWAADLGALTCAARAAAAGWHVDVLDSLAQPASGWPAPPTQVDFPGSDSPSSLPTQVDFSGSELPSDLPTQVDFRVAGIPFDTFAEMAMEMVDECPPDLVVIVNHPFLWASRRMVAPIVSRLVDRLGDVPVVLADCAVGGMLYVEREPESILSAFPGVSAVIGFSGESAFGDPDNLLSRIRAGEKFVASPAVTPPGMPMWDAVDIRSRHAFNVRFINDGDRLEQFGVGAGSLPVLGSSGCVFDCVFCTSNPGRGNTGPGAYRVVPLPELQDRLYLMKRAYGLRHAVFLDDAANLRPDFADMLRMLNAEGLRYDFPNGLRADRLDKETIELMKGRVTTLSVSCETADPVALAAKVGKRLDPSSVETAARLARDAGVPMMVHYIIGFPWETLSDVHVTLDFARRLFEQYGAIPAVQYATPVRGSRLFDLVCRPTQVDYSGSDSPTQVDFLGDENGAKASFQHRPSFVPAAMKPGELEAAMIAFRRRIDAAVPSKVIINVTYECINSCEFCAISNRVRKSIPKDRIFEILDEHRARGIQNVDFDGGEPLLHPGILEAVRHAAETGYHQINVTSNGRMIASPDMARALLKSGVTSLLISLHGESPEVHDLITGKPGSFDETLAGIDNILSFRRLLGSDVDFGVNVTICRHNVEHIEALARLMASRGVPKMNFQFLTPFGAAATDLLPDPVEAAARVEKIIRELGDRMRIYVVNAQMCLFAPEYESHLLNDLQKLGRTMVFVWEEEVNLFKYLAERRVRVPRCESCRHYLVCDGFYEFPSETGVPADREVQYGR